MKKQVASIAVFALCFGASFWLTHKGRTPAAPPSPLSAGSHPMTMMAPKSSAEIRSELAALAPTAKDRAVTKALGKGKHAETIATALNAGHHVIELGRLDDLSGEILKELEADPQASFEAIRKGLKQLPVEGHAFDHASLVYAASRLALHTPEINKLAWEEFKKASIPPTQALLSRSPAQLTPEQLRTLNQASEQAVLPITSFKVMLKTSASDEEAYARTLEALKFQRNVGLRTTLLELFEQGYPLMAQRMRSQVRASGVEIEEKARN